jgi:hypothetical protein
MLKIYFYFLLEERDSALIDGVSFLGAGKVALGVKFHLLIVFLKEIAF